MQDIRNQKWYILVEGRVYLSVGSGHVTQEVFETMDQEFVDTIEASSATLVHIINDTRGVLSIPSLNEVRKAKHPFHPRMGYNVTIKALNNPFMRFIISVSTAITKMRYKDVNSLAEAYSFLLEKDPSLPPLSTWTLPPEIDAAAS